MLNGWTQLPYQEVRIHGETQVHSLERKAKDEVSKFNHVRDLFSRVFDRTSVLSGTLR